MNVKDSITNDVHMNVKCNIAAQLAEFDNQKIEFMARKRIFFKFSWIRLLIYTAFATAADNDKVDKRFAFCVISMVDVSCLGSN